MNPSARRARRLLRASRQGPWGKGRNALARSMEPVYGLDDDGQPYIRHYRLVDNPWYVNRKGWYRPGTGTSMRTKAGQEWLRETRKSARCDVDHALSDCCGWGNGEAHHEPYVFCGSIVPPRPRHLPDPDKES